MKYLKLDLLTLLISLFILSSCESPDSIGLDIDPADKISGTLIDTTTISTQTVLEDSVLTTALSQQPVGYMQSPVFGKTEANLALGLSLPSDSSAVKFGSNLQLDSAVLVLRYGDEFYGDSLSSTFSINLHQLAEPINSSASYYNNKSWNFNSTVLASKTVNRFKLKDTIRVTEIRKGKADTIVRGLPQLRIPVSSDYINTNFLKAPADNFSSNAKFASFIKGLYLTINKSQSAGSGGVVFFVPDSSRLELYYKRGSGATLDTNVLRFPVTSSASNTKNDYTGTDVKTQLDNPTQRFERVYVQSLGGVRTKIDFPYLQQLKRLGNIAINKAELVISVDQGFNNNPFAPAPRLMLYRTDIAGQRQEVPDNDIGQINGFGDARSVHIFNFGGFYNTTNKTYTFNIASYVQDLLSGKLKQDEVDTYLAPIKNNLVRTGSRGSSPDPRVADIFPSGTTAGQSVLGSGTSPTYKMKLKIIYSKLGQ